MSRRQSDLALDALDCVKAARSFMDEGNKELLQFWLGRGRRPVDLVLVTLILAGFIAAGTTDDEIDGACLDVMAEGFPGEDDLA